MQYDAEFILESVWAYPQAKGLHKLIEEGRDAAVGLFLRDNIGSLSASDVIEALEKKPPREKIAIGPLLLQPPSKPDIPVNAEDLHLMASRIVARQNLYKRWQALSRFQATASAG